MAKENKKATIEKEIVANNKNNNTSNEEKKEDKIIENVTQENIIKVEELVENKQRAINESDIISEDKISENDVIDVKTDNIIIENKREQVKLKILIPFTDKNDDNIHYTVNDIVELEKTRAEELLKDPRKLVCICE